MLSPQFRALVVKYVSRRQHHSCALPLMALTFVLVVENLASMVSSSMCSAAFVTQPSPTPRDSIVSGLSRLMIRAGVALQGLQVVGGPLTHTGRRQYELCGNTAFTARSKYWA